MASVSTNFTRTSLQLYRDCLRLAKHIGGKSPKANAVSQMIRLEFRKGMHEKEPEAIEALKANAVRGLSNYLVYVSSANDEQLQKAIKRSGKEEAACEAEWKDSTQLDENRSKTCSSSS